MIKKWAIFRVVIIIQLVISIAVIVALAFTFYNIVDQDYDYRQSVLTGTGVCMAAFFLVVLFDCFCLYLLQRRYPDKELSVSNKILFVLSIFFISISTLISVAITIYGLTETVTDWENNKDMLTLFILLFSILYSTGLIYSLINVIKLKRAIRKNATANAAMLIDQIGS